MRLIDIEHFGTAAFSLDVNADGEMRFSGLNAIHRQMTGMTLASVVGCRPSECLPPELAEKVSQNYRRCIELSAVQEYEEELALPAGTRWWRTTLTPLLDPTGRVMGILGICVDIDDRKRRENDLSQAAFLDPLTKSANRRCFDDEISKAIAIAEETRRPFSIVTAAFDQFKSINDRYGHAAGDEVIRQVATRMKAAVRTNDVVARIGGDEFASIVSASTEGALSVVFDRMKRHLAPPVKLTAMEIPVGVSLGGSVWEPGRAAADMLAQADAAMYENKRNRASA